MEKEKAHKTDRMLDILFRAIKGEALSVKKLADEYATSSRSVSRDISALNMYLSDNMDTVGYAELVYMPKNKCYYLQMEEFLSAKELLVLIKPLLSTRALNSEEMVTLIGKLKKHATPSDRHKLDSVISKELHNYFPVKHDCQSLLSTVWELTEHIEGRRFITVSYNKMNGKQVSHRLMPLSLFFSEYYFYLIAYECDSSKTPLQIPKYFRADRIIHITAHRETFNLTESQKYDESLLRKRSQFMWPGPLRRIRFEFTGPSVQAILDRLPTARIIEKIPGGYIVEAESYGDGIKMFLLSQGAWVKVTSPPEFVEIMKEEVEKMRRLY